MKRSSKILAVFAMAAVGISCYAFWRFNQEAWPQYGKGGVGIVDEGVFVFTNNDQNMIEWHFGVSGRYVWKGKSRSEGEVVVFDGRSVQPLSWATLPKHSLVIRFTPTRIYAYDLKDLSGFYYCRWEQEPPNQAPVPTVMSVTPAADAPVAPATTAAQL